ncbi:MAG: HD family phosphohydrolase [Sumerlaeia bacterium]
MKMIPIAKRIRQLGRGRTIQSDTPRDFTRWLTLFAVFVITVLLTSPTVWQERMPRYVGQEIDAPVRNKLPFRFLSEEAKLRYEETRQETYTRVFRYDSRVVERNRIAMVAEFEQLSAPLQADSEAERLNKLRALIPELSIWSDAELALLSVLASDERFQRLALDVFDDVYQTDYVISTRDRVRFNSWLDSRQVIAEARPISGNPETVDFPEEAMRRLRNGLRNQGDDVLRVYSEDGLRARSNVDVMESFTGKVAERFIALHVEPNLVFDPVASQERLDKFPPQEPELVEVGTLLAPLGMGGEAEVKFPHVITPQEAELLQAYGKATFRQGIFKFIAQVLFVLIAFSIISFFVVKFGRDLPFNSNTVWLLGLPMILALALGRFILLIGGDASYAGYAFPAGLMGILGVMLLDVRLATLLVTWGCLLFGLSANLTYEFVIVGLFGGYTAVASLYNIKERRDVLYAGLLIGFVNAASIIILSVIADDVGRDVWFGAGIGALSGVISSLISFAVLPVFEVMFNITTDLRLLELTGIQHPLLKRMEQRAPGTLQHTLNVAKLAEAAAQTIGVNYLLVRAGVYFHDIGKMAKPEYFTENQLTPEDKRRHSELRPQMSTLIIRNHVKEGLEMAEENKLPKMVHQFIAEHHGTTLIKYFYMKALESHERGEVKEPIKEEDYRYPGPKPQTIESAVVMLADTVEAIATAKLSAKQVREDDIQKLVRDAINDKFSDGQFNECNLTMRDLNLIRESFIKTLRSRFHSRIDYPSPKKSAPEKKRTRDDETAAGRESQTSTEKNKRTTRADSASKTEHLKLGRGKQPITEANESQVNDSQLDENHSNVEDGTDPDKNPITKYF